MEKEIPSVSTPQPSPLPQVERVNSEGVQLIEETPITQDSVTKETSEQAPFIDIKDFAKVDLRVAKVLSAEKVEGADRLLKLQIELGAETRQIISGIAQHYKPEDLIGKKVIVVVNLKPAKIRGVESFGMLLAAKEGDKLILATTDGDIASNAKVG